MGLENALKVNLDGDGNNAESSGFLKIVCTVGRMSGHITFARNIIFPNTFTYVGYPME
jgi:hypothetical protein